MIAQAVIVVLALAAACCEGPKHTDARWLHWATKLEKGISKAPRWSHRPRLQRRALQALLVLVLGEAVLGWFVARGTLILALAVAGVVLVLWLAVWVYLRLRAHGHVAGRHTLWRALHPATVAQWWNHRLGYTSRLRHTLAPELGITPSHVKVNPDRSEARIRLPYTFAGHAQQRLAVESAAQTILHREGLEPDWSQLHGRKPLVMFALTEPPPSLLHWDDVAAMVDAAKYQELVSGIGHKGRPVLASLAADSPHLGIGMGTGAGKSNLAAFWLVQRLRRGDIALIVDGKRFSHPWAFKDMEANYGLLPNVGYVRALSDIHDALCWLGVELQNRNTTAERVINAKGDLLGPVGTKLFVVLEELNYVTPALKTYWKMIRQKGEPKQSPALMALSAVSFAGRAVGMHLIFIGQRLDADVLGASGGQGGAVRGNVGVRALARYDEPSWALQAGKGCPMPPSPKVAGRIQLWVGGNVSETQVPLMDHKTSISQLRNLAIGGKVTECPVGFPGRAPLSVLDVPAITQAPDQGVVLGQPSRPPGLVTISEAHEAGLFGNRSKAAVQRASTRPGFPQPVDREGSANLYRFDDLAAMQAGKELAR